MDKPLETSSSGFLGEVLEKVDNITPDAFLDFLNAMERDRQEAELRGKPFMQMMDYENPSHWRFWT